MPPQAESNNMLIEEGTAETPRNVTFAINYQVSLVDEFVSAPPRRNYRMANTPNKNAPSALGEETAFPPASIESTSSSLPQQAPPLQQQQQVQQQQLPPPHVNIENRTPNNHVSSASVSSSEEETTLRRSSSRDKQGKREVSLARTRVRYDMETVPLVERNVNFLSHFERWWMTAQRPNNASSQQLLLEEPPRRSSRLHAPWTDQKQTDSTSACHFCQTCDPPFWNQSSVVWVPQKRSEWEDSISEMTALCATAARRRPFLVQGKPAAPLSRDYISDRVDIDDPVNGFQIRHATGGWLQGFVMWTNFTTWTHYFCWDSLHPQAGMAGLTGPLVDEDGSLSRRLQALPRTGDPLVSGVIFENVAEIGLVGGLGCGEYLLRMALEDIKAKKQYKFVVLQATDSSRGFYEKFGFVRVGAVCRYHQAKKDPGGGGGRGRGGLHQKKKPSQPKLSSVESSEFGNPSVVGSHITSTPKEGGLETCISNEEEKKEEAGPPGLPIMSEPPIVGYRHWTHANESHVSLEMHGGPSYMMCLELLDDTEVKEEMGPAEKEYQCGSCSQPIAPPVSLLETMMRYSVENKPSVEQLLAGNMLSRTLQRRSSALATSSSNVASPNVKKKVLRKSMSLPPILEHHMDAIRPTPFQAGETKNAKRTPASESGNKKAKRNAAPTAKEPPAKRQKLEASKASTAKSATKRQAEKSSSAAADPSDPPKRKRGRPKGSGKKKNLVKPVAAKRAQVTKHVAPKAARRKKPIEIDGRIFYSVRGPDGRFSRVPADGIAEYETATPKDKNKAKASSPSRRQTSKRTSETDAVAKKPVSRTNRKSTPTPARKSSNKKTTSATSSKRHKSINRALLRKQKVKAYPRDRPHFYNRVVKAKDQPKKGQPTFYFVYDYDEDKEQVVLIPMAASGTLMGKRQGRPRFQCCIGATDENFVTSHSGEFEVVRATMIMKTPVVSQEAWDIED